MIEKGLRRLDHEASKGNSPSGLDRLLNSKAAQAYENTNTTRKTSCQSFRPLGSASLANSGGKLVHGHDLDGGMMGDER